MPKSTYKILWTDEAKADLKNIYDFIKLKSIEGAKNVVSDIKMPQNQFIFLLKIKMNCTTTNI